MSSRILGVRVRSTLSHKETIIVNAQSPCGPRPGIVLVVDDDTDLRESLEILLTSRGHRVVTAADGGEALAWLRANPAEPCLVLLDLMMPVMDGFELRSAMGADPQLAEIPVVVITGAGLMADMRADELPPQVLRKPIPLKTLLDTVRAFCTPTPAGQPA